MAADARLLDEMTRIAARAATLILRMAAASLPVRDKADRSPVTAADEAAEALILQRLDKLLPGVPVISEEAAAHGHRPRVGGEFLLVDPLDGTKEFVGGRPEYTVQIALVRGGAPVLGVVIAPALALAWRGIAGHAAERLPFTPGEPDIRECTAIRTRIAPESGLVVALSRSHLDAATEAFVARLPNPQRTVSGSALKFCRVAEGTADVYPRLAPTSEWDVAAGHAVLAAAGGIVAAPDGQPIAYGRVETGCLIPAFIAWGDPQAADRYRP